jgi:hypothetical protein
VPEDPHLHLEVEEATRNFNLLATPPRVETMDSNVPAPPLPPPLPGEPSAAPASPDAEEERPKGAFVWQEAMDKDSGVTYYFNVQTAERRWDPPPEGYNEMVFFTAAGVLLDYTEVVSRVQAVVR